MLRPRRRRRWARYVALGVAVLLALLYYRPVKTYMHTRHTLEVRTAEVQLAGGPEVPARGPVVGDPARRDARPGRPPARAGEARGAPVHRAGHPRVARANALEAPFASVSGMDDRAVVALQIGREPRAFRRVAVRCPFGLPAVTEQEPFDSSGQPFPTTYYLTCPHLVAAVSRLEAAGGVERWTEAAATDPVLAESLRERERGAATRAPRAGRRPGRPVARPRRRRRRAPREPEMPARPRGLRARPAGLRARRADPRRGASSPGPPTTAARS